MKRVRGWPSLPEWIDAGLAGAQNAWPSFAAALARLHAPEAEADLLASTPARARLAYDELLANQLALAVIRARLKRRTGRTLAATGKLRKPILAALPFKLTGAQKRALTEIDADLNSPHRVCACSRAMSAAARPWWRCSPWRARSKRARKRR